MAHQALELLQTLPHRRVLGAQAVDLRPLLLNDSVQSLDCGERNTVQRCVFVGNGIGPDTCAPVFSAVRTISADAWSITAWSKAFKRMRMRPAIFLVLESKNSALGTEWLSLDTQRSVS